MTDEQNMDIMATYQIYLVKQMDVLFSVLSAIALLSTNDLRMRANIKEFERKWQYQFSEFKVNMEKIVNPENAGDPEGAKAAVDAEAAKADEHDES